MCISDIYNKQLGPLHVETLDKPDAPFLKGAPHLPRGTIWTRIRIRLRSLRKNDDTIKLTENKMRIRLWSLKKMRIQLIKLTEKKNEDKVMLTETK